MKKEIPSLVDEAGPSSEIDLLETNNIEPVDISANKFSTTGWGSIDTQRLQIYYTIKLDRIPFTKFSTLVVKTFKH